MKTRLLQLFFVLSQSKLSVCFNLLFKGCLLFCLLFVLFKETIAVFFYVLHIMSLFLVLFLSSG